MNAELDRAQAIVVDSVATYLRGAAHERTGALKAAANAMVDARLSMTTAGGDPDYLGRGSAYRAWVGAALDASPLPRARRESFLAAVRHHVSTALRERVPEEQLRDRGVATEDAVTRARERRATGAPSMFASVAAIDGVTRAIANLTAEEITPDVRAALAALETAVQAARKREVEDDRVYF